MITAVSGHFGIVRYRRQGNSAERSGLFPLEAELFSVDRLAITAIAGFSRDTGSHQETPGAGLEKPRL